MVQADKSPDAKGKLRKVFTKLTFLETGESLTDDKWVEISIKFVDDEAVSTRRQVYLAFRDKIRTSDVVLEVDLKVSPGHIMNILTIIRSASSFPFRLEASNRN